MISVLKFSFLKKPRGEQIFFTPALVAGVAFHSSLQTEHFAGQWPEDSHEFWILQVDIDARLQTEIDALKKSVSWLAQKYLSVQKWLQ